MGVINGLVVTRLGVNSFIATLGTMTGIAGVSLMVSGGQPISPPNIGFGMPINNTFIWWLTPPAAAFVVCCVLLHIVVTRTRSGAQPDERRRQPRGEPTRRAALQRLHFGAVRRLRHVCRAGGGHARAGPVDGLADQRQSASVLPVVASVVLGGASLLGGAGSVIKTGVGVLIIGILGPGDGHSERLFVGPGHRARGRAAACGVGGHAGSGRNPEPFAVRCAASETVFSDAGGVDEGRLEETRSSARLAPLGSTKERNTIKKEETNEPSTKS